MSESRFVGMARIHLPNSKAKLVVVPDIFFLLDTGNSFGGHFSLKHPNRYKTPKRYDCDHPRHFYMEVHPRGLMLFNGLSFGLL